MFLLQIEVEGFSFAQSQKMPPACWPGKAADEPALEVKRKGSLIEQYLHDLTYCIMIMIYFVD